MNDQNKIISENESPVPLPSVDGAWVDMRKLLDEENPARSIPGLNEKAGVSVVRRLVFPLILLLIGTAVFYFGYQYFVDDSIVGVIKSEAGSNKDKNVPEDSETFLANKKNDGSEANEDSNSLPGNNSNPSSAITIHQTDKTTTSGYPTESAKQDPSKKKGNSVFSAKNSKDTRQGLSNQITNEKDNAPALNESTAVKTEPQPEVPANQLHSDSAKALVADTKTDTTTNETAQQIDPPPTEAFSEDWLLESGLYWTLPIPANSSGSWLMGPNGHTQPYRILFPGLWLQARHKKHILHLEINPFANSMPSSKPFKESRSIDQIPDTLVKIEEQHTMLKAFGFSMGMGCQYNITGNWWAGMSFQTIFWSRAVAQLNSEVEKIPTGNTLGTSSQQSQNYVMDEEWVYFNKFQMNLNAEAMYRRKNWQAGFRLGLSVTSFAEQDGPSHPFNAELFYRWRLFDIQNKK